ncbi:MULTISPECIES: hypothetical protein [Pseudomonas]|uniref:hypothetical protein n=1 Tax=Pseudomonas TaxID=286 RepID=UPI000314CF8E|nr:MULTISPECIES: hypothetical protein [Pseudomonas]WOB56569.1 hypothetical protein NY023_15140 [Pseudomonas sp. NBB]
MSEETRDILADVVAHATGSAGISEDAGLDQAVPDALADDIDAYSEDSERRYGHLAEGIDDPDAEPEQEEPTQRGDKTVPLGALQEERNLRKQSQDRERELQAQVAQLQAFQAQVQQFLQQAQQSAQEQAIPDFAEDPEGHLNARLQQIERAQLQQQQSAQQQAQLQQFGQQLQQEVTAIAPTVTASEDALRAEVGGEAYDAAYQRVHQYVQAELAQRYPGANPAMIAQLEQVAGIAFVQQCQQMGIDPARHIYEKAQALGFVPSGQRVPNQQRKAPPTSLSTVPAAGRAPDQRGRLTAKDIASMPQDQFDALFESMRDTQRPQF